MESHDHQTKNERIWDPLVRLFHWSLVAAFVTAWFGRGETWLHEGAGKFIVYLLIFRVVWGTIGTGSARFENFVKTPIDTFNYVLDILRNRPAHYAGHNPAGAAMIMLMLLTLAVTTCSGILMTTTKLWGNATIEYVHGQSANLMLLLIVGHLLGVIIASLQHKENLVFSMITGWKSVESKTIPYLGDVNWGWKRLVLSAAFLTLAFGIWQVSTFALNASFWRMEKIIASAAKKSGCNIASINGPTVVVHPELELQYLATASHATAPIKIVIAANKAIQQKPDLDLSSLEETCAQVALLSVPATDSTTLAAPPAPAPQTNVVDDTRKRSLKQAIQVVVGMRPIETALQLRPTAKTPPQLVLVPQEAPTQSKVLKLKELPRQIKPIQKKAFKAKKSKVEKRRTKRKARRHGKLYKFEPKNRLALRVFKRKIRSRPRTQQLFETGSRQNENHNDSDTDNSGRGSNNSGSGKGRSGSDKD